MLPFPASHNSCLGRASTREQALVAAAFLAAALHDPKGPATAHGHEWEACHDSVDWWVEFELDHGDQGRHLSINKYLLSSQSKVKRSAYRDHQTSLSLHVLKPSPAGSYQTFRWFPTMNHQVTPPGCQIEKTPSEKSGSSSFDPGTTSVGPTVCEDGTVNQVKSMLLFY